MRKKGEINYFKEKKKEFNLYIGVNSEKKN